LPQSLRRPIPQPRIEHWPLTYTLDIWLWVFFFPALFLQGYALYDRAVERGSTVWLVILPAVAVLAWTAYCRFFWPELRPPRHSPALLDPVNGESVLHTAARNAGQGLL
jgi:hypothetical protein